MSSDQSGDLPSGPSSSSGPSSTPAIARPNHPSPQTTPTPNCQETQASSCASSSSVIPEGLHTARSSRGAGVELPSTPMYRPMTGPRQNSTGSETHDYSPTMSPVNSSPLSPGSNLGQNSFIFPIRSVFQGMTSSESTTMSSESTHTPGLGRIPSRSQGGLIRTPSGSDGRRFSQSSCIADEDAGLATIQQLLQGDGDISMPPISGNKGTGQPAVVTFSGKARRNKDGSRGKGLTSDSGRLSPVTDPPHGFFSMPLPEKESAFNPRRASDGDEASPQGDSLIDLSKREARESSQNPTEGQRTGRLAVESDRPGNLFAVAKGSRSTQMDRLPDGKPQGESVGFTLWDRPGDDRSKPEPMDFLAPEQREGLDGPSSASIKRTASASYSTADIKQPVPGAFGSQGLKGLKDTTRRRLSPLEADEEGLRSLVNEFSGIVRLDQAGSYGSLGGTVRGGARSGTGSNSTRGKRSAGSHPTSSGPSAARVAQHQRDTKAASTRDSVRDFVNQQALTENFPDPNAPTPTAGPGAHAMEEHERHSRTEHGTLGSGDGLGIHTPEDVRSSEEQSGRQSTMLDGQKWTKSDVSMSVRESFEMATVSGEEHEEKVPTSDGEEPIVTFRFEHVATEDGHHVVTGRGGKLRKCEDEPITTPGAVQAFGVLMVLEENYDTGVLAVRQVSENSTELLGLSPKYLFQPECFTRNLTHEQEDVLRDNIDYLPEAGSGKGSVEEEGPQVFLLSGFGEPGSDDFDEDETTSSTGDKRREWTCWVAAHRPKQRSWNKVDDKGRPIQPPDFIVLEFELERDIYNPLMQTFEPAQLSSGPGQTPDSGSQTTLSAGSANLTGSSNNSGEVSMDSQTTVGLTPRPCLVAQAASGDSGAPASQPASSDRPCFLSRPSSKVPRGMEPLGLDGIEVDVPLERIIESTTNYAKPLRALDRMRRRGNHGDSSNDSNSGSRTRSGRGARRPMRRGPVAPGTTGTMDIFAVLDQINDQLGAAPDLEVFLKITVGIVQDLCRFHRVLIYQFDESFNGKVVAELVEWGKTTDLYKGLMFPAADIPAQARQLYMINKVRLLYDRSQTTARMVLKSKDDLEHPLDMTHCYLRAMSPIHIKYLANMHVRSSMSISIMVFGQLWGLIACHSYGHHGMRVSFPVRQMMRILSYSISRNIERLSYAERLHTRKLISTIPTQQHPTGYIVSNANDLLQIFDANAGLLVIGDGCKLLGQSEQGQAMLAIAEYLRIVKFENMKSSNCIQNDFPDLVLPRAQDTIAGLLYVPLTANTGQDFIVFLRKAQVREVQWAGKPYKDERAGETASLEPRKSFKMWTEIVTGRSRPWTDDQLESAGVLALIYGKFIQVWREKQTAMASNQLTAILLSNTSHAVRTPLSQIINTLELALAGDIDADTRSMLENSHQASRALLFHVHDLLDLTRIETGNETAFNDPFDIRQSILDAVRLYRTESARRGLEFRINMDSALPQYVIGDSRKIKTVISNLVANSVKFTETGFIEVYCGLQEGDKPTTQVVQSDYLPIEIVISDSGCGIPRDKLEAMFVTLEGADELKSSEATGLGLGLAVVARIVEQLSGQLRAESEIGVGTRFFFTLQMLVNEKNRATGSSSRSPANSAVVRSRTGSSDGSNSIISLRSSASNSRLSEIDNFVQNLGVSHLLAPVPPEDSRLKEAEDRMNKPGTFPVTDSSYPIRPSKVDTETEGSSSSSFTGPGPSYSAQPLKLPVPRSPRAIALSSSSHSQVSSRSLSYRKKFADPATAISTTGPSPTTSSVSPPMAPMRSKRGPNGQQRLRVLVVEDDVINSQILQKRLRMDKHSVVAVGNGQEAVDMLRDDWDFDAVLMDIQMPIMDGRTAAREIRKLESDLKPQSHIKPLGLDGRIPIFAVSASLYETDRWNLAENFDGWLLKPLDFSRVRALLSALEDKDLRSVEVYVQGHWERGGYLRNAPRSTASPET